jgi:multiple sugar transport system permease protein
VTLDWRLRISLIAGLIVVAAFIVLPAIQAILLSFEGTDSFVVPATWVGLANFERVLVMPEFWRDLGTGLTYAIVTVCLQLVLGTIFALILNVPLKGQALFRGVAILPYVVPTVVVAISFQWMLDGNIGLITQIVRNLGLGRLIWSDDPWIALMTVTLISVWMWTPFVTTCVLAGLQTIPDNLYAAARVDGAGPWSRFWHVTFPGLRSVLIVVIIMRGIWMFNKFDIIWLMTRGGPLGATEHLPILSYSMAFRQYDIGGGAAVATLSFLILSAFVALFIHLFPLQEK